MGLHDRFFDKKKEKGRSLGGVTIRKLQWKWRKKNLVEVGVSRGVPPSALKLCVR